MDWRGGEPRGGCGGGSFPGKRERSFERFALAAGEPGAFGAGGDRPGRGCDGAGGEPGRAGRAQAFLEHAGQGRLHAQTVAEADFFFGRVDVDVDGGRIHFDEEEAERVLAAGEGVAVGGAQGVGEGGVFDRSAVDEDEAERAVGATAAGGGEPAVDAQAAAFDGRAFDQGGGLFGADEAGDAGVQRGAGRQLEEDAAVAQQGEADLGVGERLDAHGLFDVSELGIFAAEEFAAGRHVVKEVADFHDGAGSAAPVADLAHGAAVDDNFGAGEGLRFAGGEGEARDTGDARQGFAAETERADGREVGRFPELAGGVAFEGEPGVVAGHAAAVVGYPDQGGAAAVDPYLNLPGAGIHAVFHQLLDHAGRALDHLARRHLAGEHVGQHADSGHRQRKAGRVRGCRWRKNCFLSVDTARTT